MSFFPFFFIFILFCWSCCPFLSCIALMVHKCIQIWSTGRMIGGKLKHQKTNVSVPHHQSCTCTSAVSWQLAT